MTRKKKSASQSAFCNLRISIGFVLCSAGILLALAGSARPDSHEVVAQMQSGAPSSAAIPKLTYKVIEALRHNYGYDVFADSRLLIRQTSVLHFRAMKDLRQKLTGRCHDSLGIRTAIQT